MTAARTLIDRAARGLQAAGLPVANWLLDARLARLRRRFRHLPSGSVVRCGPHVIRINDGANFYVQYKDEFVRRIYHFEASCRDPFIIDGGGNIGLSVLYFKQVYPEARVLVFEPDPAVFALLAENVRRNNLTDVELVNAGLGADDGVSSFLPDGAAGGRLTDSAEGLQVPTRRLSGHLDRPVDFLKLNIEGQELPVLREATASGRLRNVREMVLEYHGWPGDQKLGDILNLLAEGGFRYLVHDFDAETCAASKPPFRLTPGTTWFCLVYARRFGSEEVP